jgi:hypothetical protein
VRGFAFNHRGWIFVEPPFQAEFASAERISLAILGLAGLGFGRRKRTT